jgi:hypothetical protein
VYHGQPHSLVYMLVRVLCYAYGCNATVCNPPTGSQRYLFASTSYNTLPVTPKADPATSDAAQLTNSADSQARPGTPLMPPTAILGAIAEHLFVCMCQMYTERQRHAYAKPIMGICHVAKTPTLST